MHASNVEAVPQSRDDPLEFRGPLNSNLLKAFGVERVGYPDTRISGPYVCESANL